MQQKRLISLFRQNFVLHPLPDAAWIPVRMLTGMRRYMRHAGMERPRDHGELPAVNGRSRTRNDIASGISRYWGRGR